MHTMFVSCCWNKCTRWGYLGKRGGHQTLRPLERLIPLSGFRSGSFIHLFFSLCVCFMFIWCLCPNSRAALPNTVAMWPMATILDNTDIGRSYYHSKFCWTTLFYQEPIWSAWSITLIRAMQSPSPIPVHLKGHKPACGWVTIGSGAWGNELLFVDKQKPSTENEIVKDSTATWLICVIKLNFCNFIAVMHGNMFSLWLELLVIYSDLI